MPLVAEVLREQLKETLAGQHPAIQGELLSDLLALWIAGNPPEEHEKLLSTTFTIMRQRVHNHSQQLAAYPRTEGWIDAFSID